MPRIPSLAQIQVSRSPQAKPGNCFDAREHRLAARSAVLPYESESRFSAMLDQLILEHQPQSLTELMLLENCATSAWRSRRTAGFETAIHAYEMAHTEPAPGVDDLHTHAALTWADSRRLPHAARQQAAERRFFRNSLHDLIAFQRLRGYPNEALEMKQTPENQSSTGDRPERRNDPEAQNAPPPTREARPSPQEPPPSATQNACPPAHPHHPCGDRKAASAHEQPQQNQPPAAARPERRNDPEPQNATPPTREAHHCGHPNEPSANEQVQPNQRPAAENPERRNDPEAENTTPQMQEAT